jgi:hypothetical protein
MCLYRRQKVFDITGAVRYYLAAQLELSFPSLLENGSLKNFSSRPLSIMSIEPMQIKACEHCKNTGIKRQGGFNLDASTWCGCPVGEERRRRVAEIVSRSVKKGRLG